MKIERFFPLVLLFTLFCLLFTVKSILSPFIFSAIIAYLFSPIISKLDKIGISRSISSLIILFLFFIILGLIVTNILPILFRQLIELSKNLPFLIENILVKILNFINLESKEDIISNNNLSKILQSSDKIFGNIANSTNNAIDFIAVIIITPIITFYFLKDWNKIVSFIEEYLPSRYKRYTKKIILEIDLIISKYLRGQLMVCVILGIIYAISLNHLELSYGFLVGIITGILSFIPYVGMLIGVVTAYIIAIFQWGFSPYHFGLIALIFFIGQVVESNYFTPKLVGNQVGIHPIWIVFGLFTFGILFGFIGLLMAIPLTAICKILLQHYGRFYKKKYCK